MKLIYLIQGVTKAMAQKLKYLVSNQLKCGYERIKLKFTCNHIEPFRMAGLLPSQKTIQKNQEPFFQNYLLC